MMLRVLSPSVLSSPRRVLGSLSLAMLLVVGQPALAAEKKTASAEGETPSLAVLAPSKEQVQVARLLARQLGLVHYNKTRLNDELSAKIWQRYLTDLDGQRLYFYQSDINQFKLLENRFDDLLRAGDLDPIFMMYNRLQKRAEERLVYVLETLEKRPSAVLNFATNDTIENDRKDSPWVQRRSEMDKLWLNRLRSSALALKLDGKTNDDIIATLKRRNKTLLKGFSQNRGEDAFSLFMNAYTESFDPHTSYLSPRSSENFNINMSLQLEGIGAVLQTEDEYTKVLRLIPGGPASKSRLLKPNDKIVGVAEGDKEMVDVVGWRIDEVVELIRGPKDSTVRLQVISSQGGSEKRIISLVRNTVALEDQAASKRIVEVTRQNQKYKIGVIKLPTFYADFQGQQAGDPNYRSTTRDVKRLIDELKADNIAGLVLDLRNNGGGSLSEVNDLIGEFISTGPTVMVKDSRGRIETLGDGNPAVGYSGPLVVMINRMSASAAEIFAGAIQDYGRGLVVGSTSFGKGSVQSIRDLSHGQLKLTEAKFYRISGGSTQNRGVIPDIDMPDLFDATDIGESALPGAMPWDTIRPSNFQKVNDWTARLPALRKASQLRQQKDPDLRYVQAQKALMQQLKQQKTTSLNEVERRQEMKMLENKRLELENNRRRSKGLAVLKNWKDAEADIEARNPNNDPNVERPDELAQSKEAAQIVLDMLPKRTASTPSKRAAK